jgi:hypothetical protein
MSVWRDVLWRLPPELDRKYPHGWLGPDHINLFIFQLLPFKPNRKPPIEPFPHHHLLSAQGYRGSSEDERPARPTDDIPVIDCPNALETEDIIEVQGLGHRPVQILRPQRLVSPQALENYLGPMYLNLLSLSNSSVSSIV